MSPDAPDSPHLAERLENLKRCFGLCEVISSTLDLGEVLERIMTTSRQALGAQTCSLLLAESDAGGLTFTVAQGPAADKLPKGHRLERGTGIAGWVHVNGLSLLVPDAYADPRFNPEVDRRTGYTTRTILCVPLSARGRVLGVAQLINKESGAPFDTDDLEIFELIAAQAAIAIENARLHQDMLAKQRLEFDMEIAASIQRDFLPRSSPELDGFEVAGTSIPCDATGGDYYDYLELDRQVPDGFALAVGDVSGHGIPAALLMASARAMVRSACLGQDGPGDLLGFVNRLLSRDTGASGRFMTLFCLQVDTRLGRMRYAKAGHDPALYYARAGDAFEELDARGIPLGIEPGWRYQEVVRAGWKAGDILVLGTDGVWESRGTEGGMYGKGRLKDAVRAHAARDAAAILKAVLDDLEAFRESSHRHDDLTLVVLKATRDSAGEA